MSLEHPAPTSAVGNRAIAIAFIVILLFQQLLTTRLVNGVFINSYPFTSNDSFDWVLEGIAFIDLLSGNDSTPWPLLRSPGFVLVSALDHVLLANGHILLLAQTLGLALAMAGIVWIARTTGLATTPTLAYLGVLYLMPLGQYRLYILSDTLSSGLMTITCAGYLAHCKGRGGTASLRYASLAGLAAALCQTYGLIPLLVLYGCHNGMMFLCHRRIDKRMLRHLFAVMVAFWLMGTAWAAWIPHEGRPVQMGYLRASMDMAHFYLNTWVYTFGPLLPLLICHGSLLPFASRRGMTRRIPLLSLAATIAAFMALTFFYQWPESRFTFIYWPLVVAFLAASHADALANARNPTSARRQGQMALGACCLYMCQAVAFPVEDAWRPRLETVSLAPSQTWLGQLASAMPQDVFSLMEACDGPADFCSKATVKAWGTPYRQRILHELKRRLAHE